MPCINTLIKQKVKKTIQSVSDKNVKISDKFSLTIRAPSLHQLHAIHFTAPKPNPQIGPPYGASPANRANAQESNILAQGILPYRSLLTSSEQPRQLSRDYSYADSSVEIFTAISQVIDFSIFCDRHHKFGVSTFCVTRCNRPSPKYPAELLNLHIPIGIKMKNAMVCAAISHQPLPRKTTS